MHETSNLLSKSSQNKAVGVDKLPAEVLIYSSHRIRVLLTIFINGCFRYSFIPHIIINTVLVPFLKNKLKPATESDNYWPIAIAEAMTKLLELIILSKCEPSTPGTAWARRWRGIGSLVRLVNFLRHSNAIADDLNFIKS